MSVLPTSLRTLSLLALLFVSLTLAGCGGGGGGEDTAGSSLTTRLLVNNNTGFDGNLDIGGKRFFVGGYDSVSLSGLSVGKTYGWSFSSVWTTRSGAKTMSAISSNILNIN